MKKVLAVSLMVASVSASAFWNNNSPWGGDGVWQNTPWGPRYVEDNGFIGHNPHSMFTPDWFSEEMENMVDEFDEGWNDDYYGPYGYGPYNYGPNGYGFAPQGYMMTPYGPAPVPQNRPQAEQK